jgi:hypothetical protein
VADDDLGARGVSAPRLRGHLHTEVIMPAASKRRGVADAENQRVNLRLSAESYRRLVVHALMAHTTPGKLVESLVDTHLKSWRVQAVSASRTASVPLDGRSDSEVDVNSTEATAA